MRQREVILSSLLLRVNGIRSRSAIATLALRNVLAFLHKFYVFCEFFADGVDSWGGRGSRSTDLLSEASLSIIRLKGTLNVDISMFCVGVYANMAGRKYIHIYKYIHI